MEFHATIDFNDDLWYAKRAWKEGLLREFVRNLGERGIRALHWIDYGTAKDGIYDKGGYLDRMGTAATFLKEVPEPLRVVADEAKQHGMRTYSVLKVFDLCMGMPWETRPVGDTGTPAVGVPLLGGEGVLAHRWIRENPHLRAELHPSLREKIARKPIRSIRLWHDASELRAQDFKVLVSENNRDYHPYTGPGTIKILQRCRRPPVFTPAPGSQFGAEGLFACVDFSMLEISSPFIAITAASGSDLANFLAALIEVEDVDGDSVMVTHGLVPVCSAENVNPDWRKTGIAFDAAFGTDIPGRGWTHVESGGRHRFLLKSRNFIGIARGRNQYLPGVVELAYPQTRQWLTGMAERAVEFGCDGVDVRVTTHTESLDWENYGFGTPVIEEFKLRYGTDISDGSQFDRALWRRLRGEYFTQLLRDIGESLRGKGKKLSVQISDDQHKTAEEICFLEIFYDWQRWCKERIIDIAHLTKFYSNPASLSVTAQACRENNISMMHFGAVSSASDESWLRDWGIISERCKREQIGIFNIYETAGIVRLEESGFVYRLPSLWKTITDHTTG
jgi:hypothetical protein